jgi:Holliday junction resolvase
MTKQRTISKQHTGAAGELRICADLLLRGYEVYRNVSSSGVDIVAYKNKRFYRVEAKSTQMGTKDKNSNWDIRATANDSHGKIRYLVAETGDDYRFDNLRCTGVQDADSPDFSRSSNV